MVKSPVGCLSPILFKRPLKALRRTSEEFSPPQDLCKSMLRAQLSDFACYSAVTERWRLGGDSPKRTCLMRTTPTPKQLKYLRKMARPKGFEPLTPRFVVWCSIQLSYGRVCRQQWPARRSPKTDGGGLQAELAKKAIAASFVRRRPKRPPRSGHRRPTREPAHRGNRRSTAACAQPRLRRAPGRCRSAPAGPAARCGRMRPGSRSRRA